MGEQVQSRLISDRAVSAIGLGGVQWSLPDETDDERSILCIRAAVEAGVSLIDTAHAYTKVGHEAHNESLIRRALEGHPARDDVMIATKGGHFRSGRDSFPIDARPETLRRHLDVSLAALGVERIDLYQLHHPDPAVPVEESVGALTDLQREGKVDLIGVSNFSLDMIERASTVARIASVQNEFSPFRTDDRTLIGELSRRGIAYLAYSPLGGRSRAAGLREALPSVASIATEVGASIQAVVLAWLLSVSDNVVPIVGAGRSSSVLDSLSALRLPLDPTQLSLIENDVSALSNTHAL